MSEYTDREKKEMALKAGIDSGVIDLYQAFTTMYAMQNQINALIDKAQELEAWRDAHHKCCDVFRRSDDKGHS